MFSCFMQCYANAKRHIVCRGALINIFFDPFRQQLTEMTPLITKSVFTLTHLIVPITLNMTVITYFSYYTATCVQPRYESLFDSRGWNTIAQRFTRSWEHIYE